MNSNYEPIHTTIANDSELVRQAKDVLAIVSSFDHISPFSEQFLRGLEDPDLGHTHYVVFVQNQLVGLGATDGTTSELAVHPDHRNKGIGTVLVTQLPTAGVWAHGDTEAAQALAASLGMQKTRELYVMGVSGAALDSAAHYQDPVGFSHSSLENARLSRRDTEAAWLKANNEAFSWHPEQGGWDLGKLLKAQEAEWFSAADVLFLWRDEELAGFHWTKQHDQDLFEIYVVGLAQDFRGQGLGDPLVRLGLNHMQARGAKQIILYVEADNAPAISAYEKLGFIVSERHVVYQKPEKSL